jgi:hypothetical protein
VAPIWYKAIDIASNKLKLIRIQTIINIKTAKAYRTLSNEALCALTGLTPITIKIRRRLMITASSDAEKKI